MVCVVARAWVSGHRKSPAICSVLVGNQVRSHCEYSPGNPCRQSEPCESCWLVFWNNDSNQVSTKVSTHHLEGRLNAWWGLVLAIRSPYSPLLLGSLLWLLWPCTRSRSRIPHSLLYTWTGGNGGNPSHSPIGKHFPNSKYENVKNKQIQISIFAPAGTKILDLFDSEHPYLESRKSLLREFTLKSDFILMATDVSAFL